MQTPSGTNLVVAFAFPFGETSHRNSQGSILSGVLQLPLLSSQAEQQGAPNLRPQLSEQVPEGSNLQNGNSRVYKAVAANRRVGVLSRFQ